jgi:Mor family transcriptional regulator
MFEMFERLDLSDLKAEQLAPLEALMPADWPDTWKELATSHYLTLISAPGSDSVPPASLASLAVALALGVAQDMGGTQPYINQGTDMQRSSMASRVVELLDQHRQDYARVAQVVGLSERHVRRIEARWLHAERARRQGALPLD